LEKRLSAGDYYIMIRVDVGEEFPLTAMLLDDATGLAVSGATVLYNVCDDNDVTTTSGIFDESPIEEGVYKTTLSLSTPGIYTAYATCSGFNAGTEDIVVNEENIYDLVKSNRHYNISVEEVLRENVVPNASQNTRRVPLNATDYITTIIKSDIASDWSSASVSGTVYAWYRSSSDSLPYKMGGPS
jgi:hypothetical protein